MKKTHRNMVHWLPIGMVGGLLLGLTLGSLAGHISIGMCVGAALGICIGIRFGSFIDKAENKRIEGVAHIVKSVRFREETNDYEIIAVKDGKERTLTVSADTMEKEKFEVDAPILFGVDGRVRLAFSKE